jgi:hypothetical protein
VDLSLMPAFGLELERVLPTIDPVNGDRLTVVTPAMAGAALVAYWTVNPPRIIRRWFDYPNDSWRGYVRERLATRWTQCAIVVIEANPEPEDPRDLEELPARGSLLRTIRCYQPEAPGQVMVQDVWGGHFVTTTVTRALWDLGIRATVGNIMRTNWDWKRRLIRAGIQIQDWNGRRNMVQWVIPERPPAGRPSWWGE